MKTLLIADADADIRCAVHGLVEDEDEPYHILDIAAPADILIALRTAHRLTRSLSRL